MCANKIYQMIPGETTFGQCACLYARAGLVIHHKWVENQCESQKKKKLSDDCINDSKATQVGYKCYCTSYGIFYVFRNVRMFS